MLISLYLALNFVFSAEKVSFKHYSVEDGLSQNTVMAILQDRKGFMWFGTWDGLNKFDGYQFTIFKSLPGDNSNISTNRIDLIHEDKFGFIWIQTYDGKFHRFDPGTEKFNSFPKTSNRYSYGIERKKRFFESSNGDIWIATNELGAIRAIQNIKDNELSFVSYSTTSELKISSNKVNFILEDDRKNIWLGTDNGLFSVNSTQNKSEPEKKISGNAFFSAFVTGKNLFFGDNEGNLWIIKNREKIIDKIYLGKKTIITDIKSIDQNNLLITSDKAGFFLFNINSKSLKSFNSGNNPNIYSDSFYSVIIDSYQIAWLESEFEGVTRFKLSDLSVKHFRPATDAVNRISLSRNFMVFEDIDKRLWVNPNGGGFSLYNRQKDLLENFYNAPGSSESKFSNVIHSAYSDDKGNLWMCSYNKGLEKICFSKSKFRNIAVNKTVNSITSNEIRAIYQLKNSKILVATKDGFIRSFDSNFIQTGLLDVTGNFSANGSALKDLAYCFFEDSQKNIWIGTKGKGLIKLIPSDKSNNPRYRLIRYLNNPLDYKSLSSDNVYSIIEDKQGRILVGTFGGGLNVIQPETNDRINFINFKNQFMSFPINNCSKIRDMIQDKDGTIWVATANGLLQIEDLLTSKMKLYYIQKISNESESLSNNDVHALHIDREGKLWLGTFGGGLNRLVEKSGENKPAKFEIFTTKTGLNSDIVLSILEDKTGSLWFSSENNISKYDKKNGQFQNYQTFEGLKESHFSESAGLFTQKGEILFGSNIGFTYLIPSEITKNTLIPNLEFTRFQLFNQDVKLTDKDSPLKMSIGYADEIRLKHNHSVFSIEYAALDFSGSEKINYAFMLEGFEKDWNYVQKQRKATYTNLPKGTYYFKVKSTNNEGLWVDNIKTIKVVVLPSFWETYFAYFIYVVFFLSILYLVYYITRKFEKLKHDVEIEHKISDIKLRFFTNISHELRTPLTLITAPIENILNQEKISANVHEQLLVVKSNSDRMLRMINQILDFRKIQNKKMRLKIQLTSLDALLINICSNFNKEALDKNIEYKFDDLRKDTDVWIDQDKTDMIFYNLLSNAFKFTSSGKKIEVTMTLNSQGNAVVKVIDQGIGIPLEKRNVLFERFTSANEINSIPGIRGTGIGLNLVKELADLHQATIEVESEQGKGTTFTVTFLAGKEHYGTDVDFVMADFNDEKSESEEHLVTFREDEVHISKRDLPLILIVEDNEEMKEFLRKVISIHYHVVTASNGEEGLKMVENHIPDLIISDLMMPVMDGLQLTEAVKSNENTCHIPVILLTAKSAIESKLEAMKHGADDYITKPFSPVFLEARVENMLEQRRKLQEVFRKRLMDLQPSDNNTVSQDEVFIAKLLEFMDKNIENSELTVDEMVSEMAMGRTVFFNKLKSLTGLAPIEFIRELRIKRAAQLLKSGDFNVSQITYMIGMSDSRYFSKCFKKVYGVTPSEYKKSLNL